MNNYFLLILKKNLQNENLFHIIYEDKRLIILNKKQKIPVHSGTKINFCIIDQLRKTYFKFYKLDLIQRLDKDVSGILLILKNNLHLLNVNNFFKFNIIRKNYLALIKDINYIDKYKQINYSLIKWKIFSREYRMRVHKKSSQFKIIIKKIFNFFYYSLIGIELFSGKTHQIKVQLSSCGYTIIGDNKYGNIEINNFLYYNLNFQNTFLHAINLEFFHPFDGKKIKVKAPIPLVYKNLLLSLKKQLKN